MVNSSKHWGSDSISRLEACATVSFPAVMALEMLLNVYLRQQWHAVGAYLLVHMTRSDSG